MDVSLTRECSDFVSPFFFQFCDDLHFGTPLNRESNIKWIFFLMFYYFSKRRYTEIAQ